MSDDAMVGDAGVILFMMGGLLLIIKSVSAMFDNHIGTTISWIGLLLIILGFVLINYEQRDKIKYLIRDGA